LKLADFAFGLAPLGRTLKKNFVVSEIFFEPQVPILQVFIFLCLKYSKFLLDISQIGYIIVLKLRRARFDRP